MGARVASRCLGLTILRLAPRTGRGPIDRLYLATGAKLGGEILITKAVPAREEGRFTRSEPPATYRPRAL